MNLCDIRVVKDVMSRHHLAFRKEFGQNFLTDRMTVESIAEECSPDANTTVLEIGPGIGTLTYELALRRKKVIALEIDRGLIPVLGETLAGFDNVEVRNADVMEVDLSELLGKEFEAGPVAVCANLPYYITTPILMKLLESGLPFESITVMIQKEVADRLCAKAGSGDYGVITAVLAYYGEAEKLFVVPASSFLPPPKVNSAVIRIKLYREKPYCPKDEKLLFRTLHAAFAQRRKTLNNALDAGFSELTRPQIAEIIASCGFPPDIRGERLGIADFVRLSDAILPYLEK